MKCRRRPACRSHRCEWYPRYECVFWEGGPAFFVSLPCTTSAFEALDLVLRASCHAYCTTSNTIGLLGSLGDVVHSGPGEHLTDTVVIASTPKINVETWNRMRSGHTRKQTLFPTIVTRCEGCLRRVYMSSGSRSRDQRSCSCPPCIS